MVTVPEFPIIIHFSCRGSMACTLLIEASELNRHVEALDWAIVDCRFSLDNPDRGEVDYLKAHIPGAIYAHIDHDLSGEKIPGKTGRHPLPEVKSLVETFSAWGIDSGTQVVAYDDSSGDMAVRVWWLLNWLGHRNVAVLNGGWHSWRQSGLPERSGREFRTPKRFEPHEVRGLPVTSEQVQQYSGDPRYAILDARSGARFRGEIEPIDPVAGHIPGAISAPFEENTTPEGRFLSPEILRGRFEKLMKSIPPENVICYCGSGITAAHNILAIAYAGLGTARLYAGSWSEWITDAARPIATGAD
jgi:thiosulfate/3-mercaptopyruvate sulfurtransferase